MSSENVATELRTFTITPNGSWVPGTVNPLVETKSNTVKCSNGKVLLGPSLTWAMSGCLFPPNAFSSGGGSMSPTCQKVKCSGLVPFRENDEGDCSGVFVIPTPPGGTVVCSCKVKISSAGQTKVKAV